MTVYMLCFSPRYKHAGHYTGYTGLEPDARVGRHVRGHGSPLVRAAIAAGCTVTIAAIWPDGDRKLERKIKKRGGASRTCPICKGQGHGNDHHEPGV